MFDTKKFTGWPSGDCRPFIEISFKPDEIEEKYSLIFKKEKDDLDWYEGAHFYDNHLGPVVFMRHENSPTSGTTIYIDSKVNFTESYRVLVDILELDEKQIIWKSDLIE